MWDTILIDSEGRAWLQTTSNGVTRASYMGCMDAEALDDFARQRKLLVVNAEVGKTGARHYRRAPVSR